MRILSFFLAAALALGQKPVVTAAQQEEEDLKSMLAESGGSPIEIVHAAERLMDN